MKSINKKEILPSALIVLALVVGVSLYCQLPERIPSHWNAQGEIDAYSSKNFTVFFYPGLTLFVYLLMTFLPLIDPLKKNYPKFALPYFWFRVVLVLFFVSLYFYTLGAGLGMKMNINYFILPAISILFVLIGLFLPKVKKNYFVGIRTPWTLYSEEVWDKTHQFSGKLFVAASLIALVGVLIPQFSFIITMGAILLATLSSIVYSYLAFRQLKQDNY